MLNSLSDRNWLTFLSYLDSVFALASNGDDANATVLKEAYAQLHKLAEQDGRKERGSHLACLEFEKRLRNTQTEKLAGLDAIESRRTLGDLLGSYFDLFGDKASCYEDLSPFISQPLLEASEQSATVDLLKIHSTNVWSPLICMREYCVLNCCFYNVDL